MISGQFAIGSPGTRSWIGLAGAVCLALAAPSPSPGEEPVDFNRDVRRILSENCFACHGPDARPKKPGRTALRLDQAASAHADHDGIRAIVAGHPEKSELVKRITASDPSDRMPPPDSGKKLSAAEIQTLQRWIAQGGGYSQHWAYVKPVRTGLPPVRQTTWPLTAIDHFLLARLESEGLKPSPPADPLALIRRVSLDLTGLPPSISEVEKFMADRAPGAYERFVDQMLQKQTFGEHWARVWLDQARYADSAGYADDPPRTIWAYRDYVIRALNANKPFDRFTIEQLAGDLLPDPTDDDLVASAFNRNTLTNNEGGTNDEEYRNVAVVDRVNTTMAVWMGTTMACAQCHNHKYDPLSQEDYFRLFAILNNSADADRTDESPLHQLFTPKQRQQQQEMRTEIARLEQVLVSPTPALTAAQADWEKAMAPNLEWQPLSPVAVTSRAGAAITQANDGWVRVARGGTTDVYTAELAIPAGAPLTALRLEVGPDSAAPNGGVGHGGGNFVLTRVKATVAPAGSQSTRSRYVRIDLPGKDKILSLAEVQVFQGTNNIARAGSARQSSTAFNGTAALAIDGKTDGRFEAAKSTTHTETGSDPWWELDLKTAGAIDRLVIWNRADGVGDRLKGIRVTLLDEQRGAVWEQRVDSAPDPMTELRPDGTRTVSWVAAASDFSQANFGAETLLQKADVQKYGWAVAPKTGEPHSLLLTPSTPIVAGPGTNLVIALEQLSQFPGHTIARFRLAGATDPRALERSLIPAPILVALQSDPARRTPAQAGELRHYYLSVTPALKSSRDELASLKQQLAAVKPYTTIPVMRELTGNQRRKTHLQRRGNYLDLDQLLTPGLPAAFPAPATDTPPDRLALAHWLVSKENPLTARVEVNRLWESIFGTGLVRTSEEFGSQGEPPSHPALLDWLAVELQEQNWDVKHVLRLLVTSAAYRQSSRVTPELATLDPENRLLARGPRFRQTAEMVRDQALFVSGLLSPKLYGPPVKPAQPKSGLSAAFGGGIDWETSTGEDRYRRAIYTTWRRSNPYPSMATFDSPNREVCTVRRERSNTPLQALVTLNDPVYVEAAQALARLLARSNSTPAEGVRDGFRRCLSRPPTETELSSMVGLFNRTRDRLLNDEPRARELAGVTSATAAGGVPVTDLAAWTVVGNVLLNLDEMLMKR